LLRLPTRSEVGALSRLRQLLVGGRRHVPADLDQHGLHGEVALPGCYAGELGEVDLRGKAVVLVRSFKETLVRFRTYRLSRTICCPNDLDLAHLFEPGCSWGDLLGCILSYFAIARVDAGKVDFADESHVGRGVGV
jgi:hypothetical protein